MKKTLILLALSMTFLTSAWAFPGSEKSSPGGKITYEAPKDWKKEMPASKMRLDQYSLPGEKGDATMAVFFFPGTGGSVEANLQRWYGQFETAKGGPINKPETKDSKKVGEIPVTTVFLTGTYKESKAPMMMSGPVDKKPDYALWAAIAETSEAPYFFKVTGPKETVAKWRKSLEAFVDTFKMKK